MAESTTEDYGFGTDQAIDRMEEMLAGREVYRDTILINIDTLMRNRMRKGVKAETLVQEAMGDVKRITDRFVDIFQNNDFLVSLSILFYSAYYKQIIPPKFLRKPPPSRMSYDAALDMKNKKIPDENNKPGENLQIRTRLLESDHRIYRSLQNTVRKLDSTGRIMMMSHMNCDYHLMQWYPDMLLVDSFTGQVHETEHIPVKVFETDKMPFCPATHAVLGDKELIKPTYTRDEKRELIELASRENWRFKTSCESIKQRMVKKRWLKPDVRYPLI